MPARPGFPGFPPDAVAFLRELEANNDREWFQANKQRYETSVKAPMLELVAALNLVLVKAAPDFVTDPKKSVYRIYRDTRFSHDKTPYKTHSAALFARRGLGKNSGAGLYFGISHKEVEVASGMYMPLPEDLLAVRTHIAENHAVLRRILAVRKLREAAGELQGEQLSRVPKGFPAHHPAADLLRRKQFLLYKLLDPAMVTGPELFSELSRRLLAMVPFADFLNQPLASRRKDPLLAE